MASNHRYLITIVGASGHQGSAIIPRFYNNPDFHCRLACSSSKSRERLQLEFPDAEISQADLLDSSAVKTLFYNATHYFHMGPPFDPNETRMGQVAVEAAVHESKRPGNRFEHFIYSSVVGTQLQKLMNHDCKRYVEEMIMESGIKYTIVQLVNMMEYIPFEQIAKESCYHASSNPDVPQSMLATKDLGEAIAKIVDGGAKHYWAVYPLVSITPMTYRDVMKLVSKALGRQIDVVYNGFGEAIETAVRTRFGDDPDKYKRDGLERMLLYYNRRGICGSPTVLEWLLGRKPTTAEEWVAQRAKQLKF